ncbi:7-methylguanosine phosphate-specific 5'-nucleotidase isoform X2 [Daktulosphaira vitifoliae]|uniref:7-methylguanosine phosphate-specific 5'-nucleotidase isoform X2 n=1 Tax=Daktulosphaira vitifoliae TaxID=58002 RepID=UPI0021AA02A6|nr:7-methylguanosine phosphate-specific 5'-nucleotidase isoform X2 [Daktulosphaira vitifoliae]
MIIEKCGAKVHIKYQDVVNKKLQQIIYDGFEKLQIISDFDRTISCSEHNKIPTKSSFCVFESCKSLTKDYKEKAQALYHKYRPIEDDPNMTVEEKLPYIEDWWNQSEALLKSIRFCYEDLDIATKEANVKLRDGCTKAFQNLFQHNVPVIVMSAGIGDVVELTLVHEKLFTKNVSVVSNFLNLALDNDGNTIINGFKDYPIIHVFNKNEHRYLEAHSNDTMLSGRLNVILLGDSLGDANMDGGIPYNNVLRIGFLNNDVKDENDPYLHQYEHAFDIVLIQDQTMNVLNYIINEIENCK